MRKAKRNYQIYRSVTLMIKTINDLTDNNYLPPYSAYTLIMRNFSPAEQMNSEKLFLRFSHAHTARVIFIFEKKNKTCYHCEEIVYYVKRVLKPKHAVKKVDNEAEKKVKKCLLLTK